MEIDCKEIILGGVGEKYEHEYSNYLNFFCLLANSSSPIKCLNVPRCWDPFVEYLGHEVSSIWVYGNLPHWEGELLDWSVMYGLAKDKRRAVEIASTCRPELVHALYLADTEWPCPLKWREPQKSILITCNGSFFRDEVMEYRRILYSFKPTKKRAVITPCAASKPYPAPLHRIVQSGIDQTEASEKWHVIVATGTLGLIPEELWPIMPDYDAGLPYLWRCRDTVAWYFGTHEYEAVVDYADFYSIAVEEGLEKSNYDGYYDCVLQSPYRDRYSNLLLDENLMLLDRAIANANKELDQPWEE